MLDLLPNKMNKLCEKKKYGVNLCFKSLEVSFYFTADDTTLGKVKSFFFSNLVVQVAFLAVLVEHIATFRIDEHRSDKKSNIYRFLRDNSDSISSLPIIVISILTYFMLLVSFYTP